MSLLRAANQPETTDLRVWRVVRRESATYTMLVLAANEADARNAQDPQVAASSVERAIDIMSVVELVPGNGR